MPPDLDQIEDDVRDLKRTVYGDDQTQTKGLVAEVRENRALIQELLKKWDRTEMLLKGVVIGLGLNAGGLGIIISLLKSMAGGGP